MIGPDRIRNCGGISRLVPRDKSICTKSCLRPAQPHLGSIQITLLSSFSKPLSLLRMFIVRIYTQPHTNQEENRVHFEDLVVLIIGTACNAIYFFHSRNSGVKNKARCVIKVCEKWILAKFCSGSLPGGHSWWRWTLASNLWHWSGCLATFKGQDTTAGWQFWDFLKVSSNVNTAKQRQIQKTKQRSSTLWGKKLVLHEILWLF